MQGDSPPLPDPAFYFPLRHGRYDVAPGLSRFGKDLGGGAADSKVFQFDSSFSRFRAAKLAARRDRPADHAVSHQLRADVSAEVARSIIDRLIPEHPDLFNIGDKDGASAALHCRMTGDVVPLESDADAVRLLAAIGMQLQEDFAIVSTARAPCDAPEWLSFAHVCLPSGWSPSEKVGRPFSEIHAPVAGMADMNRRSREFAELMTGATDGLVRFAWGITFDDALDHHPTRPRAPFDPANPRAFLRVERQTIWGFPDVGAALFTIRPCLYNVDRLRRDSATREPLLAALRTMPRASVQYKGLGPYLDALISWISSPPGR